MLKKTQIVFSFTFTQRPRAKRHLTSRSQPSVRFRILQAPGQGRKDASKRFESAPRAGANPVKVISAVGREYKNTAGARVNPDDINKPWKELALSNLWRVNIHRTKTAWKRRRRGYYSISISTDMRNISMLVRMNGIDAVNK
ncbi:uncharacterized protein LOC119590834 [Penaeus monodon]|uniref:uncharacterized protein LOC119590834 n=1 Tax=Penaeus monodon TaxID=6687 RepID=UPI0018A70233|nr:uncharacterized protein LOC119590834 [Penaeus monodon]